MTDQLDDVAEVLHRPLYRNDQYENPWDTWSWPWVSLAGFQAGFKFFLGFGDESKVPKKAKELDKTLPVLKPELTQFESSPTSGVRHMWIGHASSLVQFDGLTFLTDPIFSDRCSMVQFLGPKRYRPPPCTIDELPKIDCVFISHNHYDHLDYNSVVSLNKRFGNSLKWYVPQGMKPWMNARGCQNVVELSWWEEHEHSPESGFKMVATPCQHWSKRTATDTNKVVKENGGPPKLM
ncbi:N-acyl-phosphatidylethanolamine-hydrolyzing phospholipase D-like [Elysia marginata]|uniref:N-acyl-phosphatidylethanolamine-hydrolyzing phospholipase D-like n=1 Tax=Elysia marginata TaxID=1093978 RepID=A0AAV4FXM4_9GAST|nr:N-acyl-phosphatidylethanolamine-hydrolyzing phospholipase D-like [Elysia marginata]